MHDVGVVVFDGVKLLDVAGPCEVLAEANRVGAAYRLTLLSPGGHAVATSTGLSLDVTEDANAPRSFDTLLVAGGDRLPTEPIEPELVDAVRALGGLARRTCSICTGAFLLADAGLLSGRRATTHWRWAALLARSFPDVKVEPDAIYVEDAPVFSSAGVTAGIDLALALVERDHGAELARAVAQSLVVFLQRPGGQSQFSPALEGRRPRSSALREVMDLIAADPAGDHSAQRLAAHAAMSSRHLTRLFRDEVETTPARYVELVRIDAAKRALIEGSGVAAAARVAGFGTAESLRRAFVARVGVSPSAYRERFATSSR